MAELRQAPPGLLGHVRIFSSSFQSKAAEETGSPGCVPCGWGGPPCPALTSAQPFAEVEASFAGVGSRGRAQDRPDPDARTGSRRLACPVLRLLPLAPPHTEAESHSGLARHSPQAMLKAQKPPGACPAEDGDPLAVRGASPGAPVHPFCGGEAAGSSPPHAHRSLYRREEHQGGRCWVQPGRDSELKGTWEPGPLSAPRLAVKLNSCGSFSWRR